MAKQKELTFEEELEKLEEIVQSLEGGNVPLSVLIARYEAGMKHLKSCQEKLSAAELKIAQLRDVNPDGSADLSSFEGEEL